MIVTILLVIVNVITRKLFNYIIIWSEEIATSCFVYSVFIGAAYAYRKHQHVGVDLLVERLPAGARRVVHLITNALLVIINGYITVLSVQFIQSSWIKRMPITKLPSSAVSTALVIGFGLMPIYVPLHPADHHRARAVFHGHPDRLRALCCGADLLRLY